jgi:putative transcriptional regulator
MNMKETIDNSVHQLRKQHQMTQEELGQKLGVTRQTVIAIEKGNYIPSLLLAMKIARVFGRPIEEIFTYAEAESNR